jgi:Protein of unknown function (DUF1670)
MIRPPRKYSGPYTACQRKTFHSSLCHLLGKEFPGTFGPAVTRLFADKVDELYERCHPPLSRVKVGQVLWLAVAADERPGEHKRIEDTRLVPVLLDLVTPADIDDAITMGKRRETRRRKAVRLFYQAFQQGAVLSEAEVALFLHVSKATVSNDVLGHEDATLETVPRRGTIHDMGASVSHKGIICYKRLVEKKSTSEVAEETYHSPQEVEYYVQCCRRIQLCRDNGMSANQIVDATGHSPSLVQEYLRLLDEFKLPTLPNSSRKDGVQDKPD